MVMEEQQSDMELDSERVPVPQVQKSSEDSHVESNNKVTSISRGKPRLRKKAFHAAILKQMEFYFSDANLSKDRFLGNLIKENPYIDLNVFVKFNKIRELTTDTNRIAKALQASTILALSEDGTRVRRVTPIAQKENTDECTIYVQNLPPDADHEMLSSIFSQYGSVAYVSVPRYKSNKKIKGFAFVEFDKPADAKKCIKSFQKKGCVLPMHTSPNELLSITTFDDAEKDVTLQGRAVKPNLPTDFVSSIPHSKDQLETIIEMDKNTEDEKKDIVHEPEENSETKKAKKRKHKSLDSQDADVQEQVDTEVSDNKKKKHKDSVLLHTNEALDSNHEDKDSENIKEEDASGTSAEKSEKHKSKKKKSTVDDENGLDPCNQAEQKPKMEDSVLTNSASEEQDNTDDKKKKRKRKRKSKIDDISYNMGLQVMTKKDWKHLRNKYLELQRSKMKQLKQHLRKTRFNQWSMYDKNKFEKEETEDKEKKLKPENVEMRNFPFTTGVIVKLQLDKPCTDPKNLKMELRGNTAIKYIDVAEGSCQAYVRLDTTDAAQAFAQKSNEERTMTILQGDEEKTYWDKILKDREDKLGKKVRIKQRGRDKLLKKAEKELGKHIKFDEV